MARIYPGLSRTFSEFLLIPNHTGRDCVPDKVDLSTPVVRFRKNEEQSRIKLNVPVVSAIMQAVSDSNMAIALARSGGLSFIFGSQPIAAQAEMVRKVKRYKAGFVTSDSNLSPEHTLEDVLALKKKTGHSTVPITDNGHADGKLLGIITSRDYRVSRLDPKTKVAEFMTPIDQMIYGREGLTLSEE